MKAKALVTCALLGGIIAARSQGTVNFNNNGIITGNPPSVLVYYSFPPWCGTPLVGTNFLAQLYYGAPGQISSLTPVASTPATFRMPTTSIPGTWIGGTRTLVGFTENMAVSLQVRVWDSVGPRGEFFPTWEMAFAAYNGLNTGTSSIFSYTIPPAGSPPAAFLLYNFQGFFLVDCPEPSPGLLISLGLLLFLFFKRCVVRK